MAAQGCVALIDQVTDQRVVGRQVQHVVLHDPGRHDQHRLGTDLVGRRYVLDQLDQPLALDHFARGVIATAPPTTCLSAPIGRLRDPRRSQSSMKLSAP